MTPPARDERRWTLYGPLRVHSRSDARFFTIERAKVEPPLVRYGESVEVMPVAAHEAALAAARQVDDAMVERFIAAWRFDLNRQSSGLRPCVESALLAALTVPEPEEKR